MFIEPLFTVVLSFIFLKISAGFVKILLCFGLLAGMAMSVQPPFLFGQEIIEMAVNVTNQTDSQDKSEDYYTGVTMALGCAILGKIICSVYENSTIQSLFNYRSSLQYSYQQMSQNTINGVGIFRWSWWNFNINCGLDVRSPIKSNSNFYGTFRGL